MTTVKVKLTEDYETTIVKLIMTQLRLADVVGPEQKKEVIEELEHLGITVMDKGEKYGTTNVSDSNNRKR
ncbi:hypothetical protein [Carnobacterium pleistocenium]|uniref:hypothetical protein n=1 Tax=Carnobacterium pleistocenium TaxID=181073 RepID=UPI0005581C78|nr:hypothetical protein [Carnobacterium pleistocenium]